MSNDAKYWILRGTAFGMFLVDVWILGKAIESRFMNPEATQHSALWLVLFGVAMLANIPLYVYYRKTKAERWAQSGAKDQQRLEVEAFAAFAQQQQIEKEQRRQRK